MIITIDGPAGSGKSTVAQLLAKELGGVYLDTGAMYRSVTLLAIEAGKNLNSETELAEIAESIVLEFEDSEAGQKTIINGTDRSKDIRTDEIDANVSKVAAYPLIRKSLVAIQRSVSKSAKLVVADGRDTGSVVFPDADRKFYFDAKPEERAKRRAEERGETVDSKKVQKIQKRDEMDSKREESPLIIPHGAIVIDNSNLSIDETLRKVLKLAV